MRSMIESLNLRRLMAEVRRNGNKTGGKWELRERKGVIGLRRWTISMIDIGMLILVLSITTTLV